MLVQSHVYCMVLVCGGVSSVQQLKMLRAARGLHVSLLSSRTPAGEKGTPFGIPRRWALLPPDCGRAPLNSWYKQEQRVVRSTQSRV